MTHGARGDEGLRPEEQLVLEASRVAIEGKNRVRIEALVQTPLDWEHVLTVATRHAVAPLMHHGLETALANTATDASVAAARQELGRLRSAAGARIEHIYDELVPITRRFAMAGVETIGLKDLTLAQAIYPDPSLRPIGDVDLLVRHEQYELAAECLAELDFEAVLDGDARYAQKYSVGRHFRREADELWVDLQWNIAQREWDLHGDGAFTYDVDRMWRRARPLALGAGREPSLLAPSDEDMLFHLCLHAEGHKFGELILLCDIAELLRTRAATLDWAEVLDLTHSHRASSPVYYTLRLTEQLLGVGAPDDVMVELEPPYFQGSLFGPIFSNLGPLHESLDVVERAAKPPAKALARFETLVRAQALQAMRLAAELDTAASSFTAAGGQLVVAEAQPSPRLFPDDRQPPFGEIELLVLDADAELMLGALRSCGFEPSDVDGELVKHCSITPRDPALAARAVALTLRAAHATGLDGLPRPEAPSKRRLAREAISARLPGRSRKPAEPSARVTIRGLSAEELIARCAASAASSDDRLFGLCSLLGPFERLHAGLDWQRFEQLAVQHGVGSQTSESLTHLSALLDDDERRILTEHLSASGGGQARTWLLEWARYGSDEMHRHRDLRSPFFFLLALLSADTAKERGGYALRSLGRRPGDVASFANLFMQAARGLVRARGAARSGELETIYWLGKH